MNPGWFLTWDGVFLGAVFLITGAVVWAWVGAIRRRRSSDIRSDDVAE